ncbi:MAG: hypothetical protein FJ146_12925 [Deltaproteobacteria bacterium]|nr:hypothetical protein [Deltaproteobacteria bacterium]
MMKDNKWTVAALAVIAVALLSTRGGMASLVPLLRNLMPLILAVLAYRFIVRKVRSVLGQNPEQPQQRQSQFRWPQSRPAEDEKRVIDLCPKCGAYMRPGHRCSRN